MLLKSKRKRKAHPPVLLESLYSLSVFNALRLSLLLYLAHLYQMEHQLKCHPSTGSETLAYLF